MVIRAAGDDAIAEAAGVGGVGEALREGFGVGEDGALVFHKSGGLGLVKGDGERGDGVVVRSALVAWKDGGVDRVFEAVEFGFTGFRGAAGAFTVEDHGTTRATERFMGGGGDDVGVGEGGGDDAGSDQAGYMGHVGEEVGVCFGADGRHALVVD